MSTDNVDTKLKLTACNRRGTNLQLIFSIARMVCDDKITIDPILNLFDMCLVKFQFELDETCKLQIYTSFKKNVKAKGKQIGIKITHADFERQCVVPEEWMLWIRMGPSIKTSDNGKPCAAVDKVAHPFLINLEVNIKVYAMTPKPLSVNQKLYEDATFTDFNLKAEDGLVAVHKAVLSTCSDVFLAMLNREWKETNEGTFSINRVTMQTLRNFKDYMYLQTVPDHFLQLQTLLLIANCYMIDDLKTECIKKLVELVTPDNFNDLVEFACLNNVPDLMKAVVTDMPERIVKGIQEKNDNKQVSSEVKKSNARKRSRAAPRGDAGSLAAARPFRPVGFLSM